MPDQWQLETFQDLIGTSYRVEFGETTTLELTLTEARLLSAHSRSPDSDRDPFSLIYHGPLEPVLPQGIYRFSRGVTETMEIFIVPIGPADGGMQYEAIIN